MAEGGGVAVAHRGEGDIRVVRGYAISLELFEAYARELDVNEKALASFFRTLEREAVPPERLDDELRRIAASYLRLRGELRAFRPDDAEVQALRDEAARAVETGELEEASRRLLGAQRLEVERARAAQRAAEARLSGAATLAAMRADLAMTQLDYTGAAETLREALDLLPRRRPERAHYLERLSEAERLDGRFFEALEAADEALGLAEAVPGSSTAGAHRLRARAMRELGHYEAAEGALVAALGEAAEGTELRLDLLIDTAELRRDRGKLRRARAAFEEVSATLERDSPAGLASARVLHGLGRTCFEAGDWAGAVRALERCLEIRRGELPPDHPTIARALADLALVHRRTGRLDAAEALYEEAHGALIRILGPTHPDVATSLDHLAGLAVERTNPVRARDLYRRAISLASRALGERHPDVGQAWNNLGCVDLDAGEVTRACESFRKAADVLSETLGKDHPDYADAIHNLAGARLRLGDVANAEEACERAFAIRMAKFGLDHPATAESLSFRGSLHHASGRLEEAHSEYAAALDVWRRSFGEHHVSMAQGYCNLARLHLDRGDGAAAMPIARRALRSARRAVGLSHPATATALNNLGHAAFLTGRHARAVGLLDLALSIRQRLHAGDHAETVTCLGNLVVVLETCGESERAKELGVKLRQMERRLSATSHAE